MFKRSLLMGLFSLAILASEIALTRIFSVIFWYHFGFLIISTSLLGFGMAGVLLRLFKNEIAKRDPEKLVVYGVSTSGLLLAASLSIIAHHHFSPLSVSSNMTEMSKLVIASLVLLPPFVVMGGTVIFMLQQWSKNVSKLYAANLIGSGVGCMVALLLMDAAGGLLAYIAIAAFMPFIAALFVFKRSKIAFAVNLVLALLICLSFIAPYKVFPVEQPEGKVAGWAKNKELVYSDWTSLSKVDIFKEDTFHGMGFGLWGLSPKNEFPLPERLGVVIDYWAYTTIIKHKEERGYYDWYMYMPMYLPYRLLDKPSALVIGAGGGMDIRGALVNGASHVDAVEINPVIYKAMKDDLAYYSGNIYSLPNVNSHLAEGRRFVESSEKKYDIVQLSGVDTYSATQAGAFALSENFLYTKEAVKSYLNHLNDDGIVTLTRWYVPSRKGLPRFSMRLFTLAVESLQEMGYSYPWKNILFIRSGDFTVIMLKNKAFSNNQIRAVESECNRWGYSFIYRPDKKVKDATAFYSYVDASDRAQWRDKYPFNVDPPTDDSPFFFEHRKMRNIHKFEAFVHSLLTGLDGQTILAILLLEMLLVSAILIFLSYSIKGLGGGRPLGWLYFAAIGMGFMLFEVTFTQRLVLFLGHPAYALSVVMFSILVFSGIGSLVSEKLERMLPIPWLLGLLALGILLWALGGGWLLNALIAWPKILRILVAIVLIAPVAFMMGTAFPTAVRRLTESGEKDLGMYWAWNGVASVTASVLAVIIAMGVGFSLVLLLAMGCYVLAAILLPRLSHQ